MRVIDRYIATQVVINTLLVLLVLTALASLITFVGEFGHVGQGKYTLLDAATYTLLYVPSTAYSMFVVAAFLGAMLGLGELASHNELMVMRTAGLSVARLGLSMLTGGVVLLAVCVVLGEFVAPVAQRHAESMRSELIYNQPALIGNGGIWAKDGDVFLNIRQMSKRNSAQGIYIYRIDSSHQLLSSTEAASAVFNNGVWLLKGLHETRLTPDGATTRNVPSEAWHTYLGPGLLSLFVVDTDSLSARGLYQYIEYLRSNGINADRYVTAFWSRAAQPLSLLVMMLLVLPFVFGPFRSATTGQRLVAGMLIGVVFSVFDNIFMQSGLVFGFNPMLTAWLPTLLLAAICGVAVSRIR
ncbi:MAG: LPS export ABC transporter permease LptG [Gammaproteobacteria bacterium]|nr:LPS export ABC transporter permease LptG [Gammaproteobacteria bacterium]MDE2346767.1 LPS export ABC transporter permease LptG [Gammaproteobacteria bacterium]